MTSRHGAKNTAQALQPPVFLDLSGIFRGQPPSSGFTARLSVKPQLDRVAEWARRAGDVPLVGIGGLVPERLPGLFAAGAASAAVVTDIAQAKDPEARCRDWIAATERYRQ